MRICISALQVVTAPGKRKAGVGRHMLNTLSAIARVDLGVQYEVFLPRDVEPQPGWQESKWVNWHFVDAVSVRQRLAWEHWHVGRASLALKCDLLHALFPAVPFGPSAPMCTTLHDALPKTHAELFTPRMKLILNTYHRHAGRRCRRLAVVSEWSRRSLHEAYGIPLEKMDVVYQGPGNDVRPLSATELDGIDLTTYVPPNSPYLFTVSTVEPRKNLRRTLEAFAMLKQNPAFARHLFLIAGAKGWMESDIADFIESAGLGDSVKFLGYVEDSDLNALIQRCELFVFTSIVEGFGVPAVEAQKIGAPLLTSNTSALPEAAGPEAWMCDPLDVESIASTMERALTERDERERRRVAGIEYAKRFSWDASIVELNKVWRRIVE